MAAPAARHCCCRAGTSPPARTRRAGPRAVPSPPADAPAGAAAAAASDSEYEPGSEAEQESEPDSEESEDEEAAGGSSSRRAAKRPRKQHQQQGGSGGSGARRPGAAAYTEQMKGVAASDIVLLSDTVVRDLLSALGARWAPGGTPLAVLAVHWRCLLAVRWPPCSEAGRVPVSG